MLKAGLLRQMALSLANIQIEVRDPLSETSATNRLNELTIYVNEERPYETIGSLASQAQGTTGPGLAA